MNIIRIAQIWEQAKNPRPPIGSIQPIGIGSKRQQDNRFLSGPPYQRHQEAWNWLNANVPRFMQARGAFLMG